MQGLEKKMAKGAIWMVLFKFAERGLGLVSTIVLARLLVPADFGLVAMAMSIAAILEVLTSFSFDLALIQNQQAERRHYDTAWTFNVIAGVMIALFLVLLAVPMAAFYREARVEGVMYFLSVCFLVQSFSNIGVVAFQKDLELHKEFSLGITRKLVQILVTLLAAWTLGNYWALLIGILTARVVGVALSYWMHPFRPRFSLQAAGQLFHFSKWLLINNCLIFLNNRGLDFIIGRIAGPSALGLYNVAYEVSNLPTTELVQPITRAVYPGYARISGDAGLMRQSFLDVIALIVLVSVPIGAGIACLAEPLVTVFLGPKWIETVGLIQLLALYGINRVFQSNTGAVYVAVGQPKYISLITVLHLMVAVPGTIVSLHLYGIQGAPWGPIIASLVSLPVNFYLLFRMLDLDAMRFVRAVWRPVVGTLLMCATVAGLQYAIGNSADVGSAARILALGFVAGAGVYVTVVIGLWRLSGSPQGAERAVVTLLFKRFPKLRTREPL